MSGLNQRFTKPPNLNWFREFESHFLRNDQKKIENLFLFDVASGSEIRKTEARSALSRGREIFQ